MMMMMMMMIVSMMMMMFLLCDRFRVGVQRRNKLSTIHRVIQDIYHYHLRKHCWKNWIAYLARRRFMHSHTAFRRQESLNICMNLWKLHTAIEIQFKKASRRLIMKKIFHAWKYYVRDIVFDKWAMIVTNNLHRMQFIRKIFTAWKRKVIFLDWNNPLILHWEQIADIHYLRSLFTKWVQYSSTSRSILQKLSSVIPKIIVWMHFHSWYNLCNLQWLKRGRLLRRFFRHMKMMVLRKNQCSNMFKCSMSHLVSYKLRWVMKRWDRYVRSRCMYITDTFIRDKMALSSINKASSVVTALPSSSSLSMMGRASAATVHLSPYPFTPLRKGQSPSSIQSSSSLSSTHIIRPNMMKSLVSNNKKTSFGANRWKLSRSLQIMSHRQKRWAHSCFITWSSRSSVSRRQKLCHQTAYHKHKSQIVLKCLSYWYANVKYMIKQKRKHRRWLLMTIWNGLQRYVVMEKKEKRRIMGVAALTKKVMSRWMLLIVRQWFKVMNKEKRCRHIHSFVIWKNLRRCSRVAFNKWRCKWSSLLYWRIKDLHIEYDRVKQLNDLHEESIIALEQKNNEINQENDELEVALSAMQEDIHIQSNLIQSNDLKIASKEKEKYKIQQELYELRLQLRDTLDEKERMRVFESQLQYELQQHEAEKERLKEISRNIVRQMEEETNVLHGEVRTAREQAALTERLAESELKSHEDELISVERESINLQERILSQRLELERLEAEQSMLMEGLDRVQHKLEQVNKDGLDLIAETEAKVRSKSSAVRVLQSNAGRYDYDSIHPHSHSHVSHLHYHFSLSLSPSI